MSEVNKHRIAVFACVGSDWEAATIERYLDRAHEVAKACTEWRKLYYLHRDDVEILDPHVDLLIDPDSTDHPNYAAAAIMEYQNNHPEVQWTHCHLMGGGTYSGYAGFGRRGRSVVFNPFADLDLHSHEVNGH